MMRALNWTTKGEKSINFLHTKVMYSIQKLHLNKFTEEHAKYLVKH